MAIRIRNIIQKVLPTLKNIEENPTATILRISNRQAFTPFDSSNTTEDYNIVIKDVPIIFSEKPEIITSGSNITTQQQLYIYIHENDLPSDFGKFVHEDRIIFRDTRYKPTGIRYLFGLWELRLEKV